MKKTFFAVIAVVFIATSANAGVSLAGYYDTREQENLTLQGFSALPHGFGVWCFVDFWTNRADSETGVDDEADFTSFYGEANLSRSLTKNFQLMLEINDGSAVPAVLRPGVRYWIPFERGKIGVIFSPYRIDLVQQDPQPDPSGQFKLVWNFNLHERVTLEGFADFNWFWEGQEDFYPFVTETQLVFKLTENSSALIEYRFAALNRDTKEADEGVAFGLRYTF